MDNTIITNVTEMLIVPDVLSGALVAIINAF